MSDVLKRASTSVEYEVNSLCLHSLVIRGEALDSGATEIIYRVNVVSARLRRVVDIFFASLMLVVAAPILVVASAAILVEDGGPIIFRQRRRGPLGLLLSLYH